jgi:predicted amidohydrolase
MKKTLQVIRIAQIRAAPEKGNITANHNRTRSCESEVFIAFTHPRQSLITDPNGEIVCNVTNGDAAFTVTEIDLSQVDAVRTGDSSHLRDRRPDLYLNEI